MNPIRTLAFAVLLLMLAVIAWASLREAIWSIPSEVAGNPWFIATLADAYCGFIVFYAWVAYRETSWAARVGWFVALMALGNVATAVYLLRAVSRLPKGATAEQLLLRRPT